MASFLSGRCTACAVRSYYSLPSDLILISFNINYKDDVSGLKNVHCKGSSINIVCFQRVDRKALPILYFIQLGKKNKRET